MSVEGLMHPTGNSCGFVELAAARMEEFRQDWWRIFMELPDIPYGDIAFYMVTCTPDEATQKYDSNAFARLLASQVDAGNLCSVEVFKVAEDPGCMTLLAVVIFYRPVSAGPMPGHPSIFCAVMLEALGMRLMKMSIANLYDELTPNVSMVPGFCFGLDVNDALDIVSGKEEVE